MTFEDAPAENPQTPSPGAVPAAGAIDQLMASVPPAGPPPMAFDTVPAGMSSSSPESELPQSGLIGSLQFDSEPPWSKAMGIAQVLTVVAAAGLASVVGSIAGLAIDLFSGDSGFFEELATGEMDTGIENMIATLPATLVLGTIFQQLGQGLSPFLISKLWKGYGVAKDWGLRFKWVDIPIGVGLAVAGLLLAWLVSVGLSPLVGVEDASEADNGVIVSGFKDSIWLYPMLFAVVIGAPLSEEIAFRGVVQRSMSRFGGPLVGILGSSVLFAVVHIGGTSFGGQIVLWASIFMIGLVFAVASAYFKRLGPCIVGHVLNNLIAAVALLAAA